MKAYSVIIFNRNSHNTKTKQLIRNANKLTALHTIRVHTKRRFRTDYVNPPIIHPLSQYNNKIRKEKDG